MGVLNVNGHIFTPFQALAGVWAESIDDSLNNLSALTAADKEWPRCVRRRAGSILGEFPTNTDTQVGSNDLPLFLFSFCGQVADRTVR